MFKRKSKWEKLTGPVTKAAGTGPVKSGATAVATAIGVTVTSAAVSAVRRRVERS